jgi:hypothetical protein
LVTVGLTLAAVAGEPPRYLSVSAGQFDRQQTLVTLRLPRGWLSVNALQSPDGSVIPLQVEAGGQASFILPQLSKDAVAVFAVKRLALKLFGANVVQIIEQHGALSVRLPGQGEFLVYRTEAGPPPRPDIKPIFLRAGYIHPLRSPAGRLLTDDYPPNHLHHHGIWSAWPKTEFEGRQPNFWEMGVGTGTVEAHGTSKPVSGPVWGGFLAYHRLVDLSVKPPKTALNETWLVKTLNVTNIGRPCYLFDLVSTQVCATGSPVKLPQYRYGGIGVRGNWQWNGKDKTQCLTSEGITDRVKAHESRARWCYLGGMTDGHLTGLALLSHPDNFRAPQPMRVHPEEPFVNFAPTQAGEFVIKPGEPYVARHRIVVFDGPPNREELDRLWNDYAYPPVASAVMPGK